MSQGLMILWRDIMANQRNDHETRQQEQGAFAQQGQQSQAEREDAGQEPFMSPDGSNAQPRASAASGQPLGGNDSNTGTGTTLSQGFEPSAETTLAQPSGAQQSATQTQSAAGDPEGSGFIAAQGTGSDDYLQQQNPELSQQDSLTQQDDDGMGSAGSEQSDQDY
jgi:hypothetical protein